MNPNTQTNAPTLIHLALTVAGAAPTGESLRAVASSGGPGRFTLRSNALGASLRLGDVVHTALDGCGRPQVVGVSSLHPGPVSVVELPAGIDVAEVRRVADSWRALGAEHSEGDADHLVTAWIGTATTQSVCEVVGATAPGWRLIDVATAPIRAARLTRELDLRVDRRTPIDLEREHGACCKGEFCDGEGGGRG